jgi:hypothetical protein
VTISGMLLGTPAYMSTAVRENAALLAFEA